MQRTFVGGVDHIDLVGGDLTYRLTGLDTVPRADQPFTIVASVTETP